MPIYPYLCKECDKYYEIDKPMAQCSKVEQCSCGNELTRIFTMPRITGTRDSFGIKNEFYCPHTKTYITNNKEWERAGYKDIEGGNMSSSLKAKVKEKIKKINFYKSKGIDPAGKTGLTGD